MLAQDIKTQLQQHFSKLTDDITLAVDHSHHDQQNELRELLESVASCSSSIRIEDSNRSSKIPSFSLRKNKQEVGIRFQGIPSGHEFTSLILAILNSGGLGKLPDDGLIDRMRRLKLPEHLSTYVSLSCENCPEVVQNLNLIAIYNEDFSHTMIDGGLVQEDVDRLNIVGVPSVIDGNERIHSGKGSLADILATLENTYGLEQGEASDQPTELYDVAVVGGGPAGISAAIYTARKGLKTIVLADKIGGQLQETKGIENMISVVYTEGPQLSSQLESHMKQYPIKTLENRRVNSISSDAVKTISLDSGEVIETKSVIIASGAKWRQLGVPGELDYIGSGVAYCPHCDGPFYKGQETIVVGGGNSGIEAAIDLAGICKSVTVIEYSKELKADQVLIDKANSLSNVTIITNAATQEIIGDGSKANGLRYEDRDSGEAFTIDAKGIFVQIGLSPNSSFVRDLVKTNAYGEIEVDTHARTSIPGIYAAGDVTTIPYKQIIVSMGHGSTAGLAAFEDLALRA